MFFDEVSRAYHLDACVTGDAQEMSIATDYQPRAGGDGARDELVVVGIVADRLRQWGCVVDFGFGGKESENRLQVDWGELRCETVCNLDVLADNFFGDAQAKRSVPPRTENLVRRPGEEDAGNEYVGVEDDSQRPARTSAMVLPMSDFLSPASLAWRRA